MMKCPTCGAELGEGVSLCSHCGANLGPQGAASQPLWKRRVQELKWIIVAYIILSLACMSCACLVGYRTQWILWKLGLR